MEYIDTEYYGDDGALPTCGKDCLCMHDIAVSQNFESSTVILNENATREAVTEAIEKASRELEDGDILFISYSGHGTSIEDISGDEKDNKDEAWCLYNGFLLDDELKYLWTLFGEGVRIFIISDSCHSGTITKEIFGVKKSDVILSKLFPVYKAQEVYFKHKDFYKEVKAKASSAKEEDIKARVKLIAGCQDDESSYVLPNEQNSLLTMELNRVWDAGQFMGTTEEFFAQIKDAVVAIARENKIYQEPNLFTIGAKNPAFDSQKPFGIYEIG